MSTVLTDECQHHYEQYAKYFEDNEKTYLMIIGQIIESKGEHERKFKNIFKMSRTAFLNFKTPAIFNGTNEYTEKTMRVQRTRLKKLGIADDDGNFTNWFFDQYILLYDKTMSHRKELLVHKKDSEVLDDIDIEDGYDYDNTMDVIRDNPRVKYHLKHGAQTNKLDYYNTSQVQTVKLNHVGGNPVAQLTLEYHYFCPVCNVKTTKTFHATNLRCDEDGCNGKLIRTPAKDSIRPVFASQIVADDLNTVPIISLTEIPQGEFIGAGFLCRNKANYYLFLIATEDIEPMSSTMKIDKKTHAIWQIIEQIDQMHEDRLGKHIYGLEWYKAAILLVYLANCKGRISTNLLIIGPAGIGKTSTPRFYMATLTPQQKVQDATQLTGPGLHGSMAQIKIGDNTVNVPEAGLLARHKLVVIDEMFENRQKLLPQLKTALMSQTLTREIHGMRTQSPKYASAIATSNLIPSVVAEQNRWMMRWIMDNYADDDSNIFARDLAQKAMENEWAMRGLEWRSGQPLPDMDRWPLIFFVRDPLEIVAEHDLGAEDMEINDLELAKMFYESNIDEYFQFHGRIEVDWRPHSDRIIELVKEFQQYDHIHSKKRLGQHIVLMLQLSAQINGRSELTVDDFEFVRELWSKTCDWIDIDDLNLCDTMPNTVIQDWDIERIKNRVHAYMTECVGTRYYLTDRGFTVVASKLEDEGAPIGLIESTIERYKQNPNQ